MLQSHSHTQSSTRAGLESIEKLFDYDTYLYILRRIDRIIKCSFYREESQSVLKNRLARFDNSCGLNGLLASIPLDLLIDQIGDAQLIYRL